MKCAAVGKSQVDEAAKHESHNAADRFFGVTTAPLPTVGIVDPGDVCATVCGEQGVMKVVKAPEIEEGCINSSLQVIVTTTCALQADHCGGLAQLQRQWHWDLKALQVSLIVHWHWVAQVETWATGGSGAAAQMDKSYKHTLGLYICGDANCSTTPSLHRTAVGNIESRLIDEFTPRQRRRLICKAELGQEANQPTEMPLRSPAQISGRKELSYSLRSRDRVPTVRAWAGLKTHLPYTDLLMGPGGKLLVTCARGRHPQRPQQPNRGPWRNRTRSIKTSSKVANAITE
ncbi:hypothetical protein THAOC_13551 [Thalassiosira oceanica]|uniref:Uncharacterized protein n=1 Tax=Thalassiosira oceanica TaxID=159749 RepID=K0SX59_THAOC|nr:hypothetical protein THAOC_13551 [Thalassiosira oceanica]|eukprot:EJK65571.1 hypothetical protein THAOC_13551 [Thalassiosira oceanica]